jgi:hypothetical protein
VNEVDTLASDWSLGGGKVDTPSSNSKCVLFSCRTLPFAALLTRTGRKSVCLTHYEDLRRASRRNRRAIS